MTPNSILPTFRLEPGTAIAQTGPGSSSPVTIGSPALEVMTDLTQVKAATIGPLVTLRQAEQTMVYLGVRMLFVVSDMPTIEGLITTTDLHGEKQMQLVHERRARYDDLCVADVMSGLSILDAIDFNLMKRAVVGDLIATLKRFGRNHFLVVEHATSVSQRRVRGVISRSQIERQLGETVEISPVANSYSEIKRVLA